MATRREIVEGILFLPAMALLAVVIFGGMYLSIMFGGLAVNTWYALLHRTLHLPHSVALALTVMLSAATVWGTIHALSRIRRRRKGQRM